MAGSLKLALRLRDLCRDRRGISALEYGILAAIVVVALLVFFGDPVNGLIGSVFQSLFSAANSGIAGLT